MLSTPVPVRNPLTRVSLNGGREPSPGRASPGKPRSPPARAYLAPTFASLAAKQRAARPRGPTVFPRLRLADFLFGRKLGKGKFGKVYLVRHNPSGFVCALKVMEKAEIAEYKVERQFQREVEIQARLYHPNIVRLYGHFHDAKRVYLLLEYSCHGELYRMLTKQGRFSDVDASCYVVQTARAIRHLHARGIIHRDIKPENLLLGANNTVKLSDFGWLVRATGRRATMCGTLDYLPPEMVELKEYDARVDVWLLGVLAYEFLVGVPPFEDKMKNTTYRRIASVDLQFPGHVTHDAQDFVRALLQHDPAKRMRIEDVEKHPWVVKNKGYWMTGEGTGAGPGERAKETGG